jgi:RNA polymerase sigma-70 factor (ECF subfamily)
VKPFDTTDESALVARAKADDFAAFEELANRFERRVYAHAIRILGNVQDAEDVTQQAFLSALENIKTFRGESSFSTWILSIATHAALKLIRKRKRLVSLDAASDESDDYRTMPHPSYVADWRDSPEELVHRREMAALLNDALAQLDEKHRVVFLLRDVEGLSVRETAHALELSEDNTKVRLLRARLQLREILTRELGDPAQLLEPAAHDV